MRANRRVYTVEELNSHIKGMFARDNSLQAIFVKGEVSNCKYHPSGHIYFTLKDSNSEISAVMFAGQRGTGLSFRLQDGQQVIIGGTVGVYEKAGRYQLYAQQIIQDGAGMLYERYEQLKAELEESGMFAAVYKQPIPKYIRTLGVVTADTGAAVRDIIQIVGRRNPYVQIILYPAIVQGENAVPSIVNGIRALERMHVDVMIVGRGGGSIEDLWAFNEREVAQAVFDCTVPIISAVGHETDTTIIDYVSDLRAPTPSAAAELAVTDIRDILNAFAGYKRELDRLMRKQIEGKRSDSEWLSLKLKTYNPVSRIREQRHYSMRLEEQLQVRIEQLLKIKHREAELLDMQLRLHDPTGLVRERKQYCGRLEEQLQARVQQVLRKERHKLDIYIERLKGLSPLEKLQSGFSYVEDENGHNIHSIEGIATGQNLIIRVQDGNIHTQVTKVQEERR
ncbi:MAG: exodeoxyribonuclease VII large subunit [Lachnospiraceae bacterium]|nr:exodeoxyribonuclease VII large subunit [Lachnospiraceae bacterium]